MLAISLNELKVISDISEAEEYRAALWRTFHREERGEWGQRIALETSWRPPGDAELSLEASSEEALGEMEAGRGLSDAPVTEAAGARLGAWKPAGGRDGDTEARGMKPGAMNMTSGRKAGIWRPLGSNCGGQCRGDWNPGAEDDGRSTACSMTGGLRVDSCGSTWGPDSLPCSLHAPIVPFHWKNTY